MPLTFQVRPDPPLITIVGSGAGGQDEVVQLIKDVASAAEQFERFGVLADMRRFQYAPPLEEAREVANAIRALDPFQRARIAIICPDLLHLGLARFVAAIASQDGIDIESFRETEPAHDWLQP